MAEIAETRQQTMRNVIEESIRTGNSAICHQLFGCVCWSSIKTRPTAKPEFLKTDSCAISGRLSEPPLKSRRLCDRRPRRIWFELRRIVLRRKRLRDNRESPSLRVLEPCPKQGPYRWASHGLPLSTEVPNIYKPPPPRAAAYASGTSADL
jgi:hypothetical protein